MHQNHRENGHGERIVQYAIELFDLVDITPAVRMEEPVAPKRGANGFIRVPILRAGLNGGHQGLDGKINHPGIGSHHGQWYAGANNNMEQKRVLALQSRGQAC